MEKPKEEPKTAWVGVLHDKLNEYHPAEYELKDIYQGEGCLPHFPDEELCQIWCDSKYKEESNYNMKQEILAEMEKQETLEEAAAIYAHKSFIWPLNKQGEKQSIPPGQLVPPGYTKHQKIATKHFINGAKWQQEQIGKSEFLQRLRGTLSDAEARRLIFETFKNK